MSISAINSSQSMTSTQSYDKDTLKAQLSAMAKGQSVTAAGTISDDSSDEETRIITRVQADGSQIIMVMQGDEVISERKVGGNDNKNDSAAVAVNTQVLAAGSQLAAYSQTDEKINQYEAGNAIAAGLVFNSSI